VSKSPKSYKYFLSIKARDDYQYWERNNPKQIIRIAKLIEGIISSPYTGIGKPKALGHDYQGAWSRRIDSVHRIVYEVDGETIYFISMRGHYGDK
jgi:toxin YoeB